MASTISSAKLFQVPPLPRVRTVIPVSCKAQTSKPAPSFHTSRRNLIAFSLTAMPVKKARESASSAEDIPLFRLRKNLKQEEEKEGEIVKEDVKKIETAQRSIETAERETETTGSFGRLAYTGAVAGVATFFCQQNFGT